MWEILMETQPPNRQDLNSTCLIDGCMGLHYGLWWTNQWTAWNNYAQLGQQLECNPLGSCHGAMNGSHTQCLITHACTCLERERDGKKIAIYTIYIDTNKCKYRNIYIYIYVDTDMNMNWYGDRDGSKPLYAWWTSIYVVFNGCSSTQTWYL